MQENDCRLYKGGLLSRPQYVLNISYLSPGRNNCLAISPLLSSLEQWIEQMDQVVVYVTENIQKVFPDWIFRYLASVKNLIVTNITSNGRIDNGMPR